jgi:hypothetical protein
VKSKLNLQVLQLETKRTYTFKNPLGTRPGVFYLRGFFIACLFVVSQHLSAQAKIEIVEAKKNFGTVKKGEVVVLNYEIKNAGNAPLIINDAEVSCSCTTVDYSNAPVLPGQTTKVVVSFNTKTVYERQDRVVYIHSNDPKSPAKIRYKGFVKTE